MSPVQISETGSSVGVAGASPPLMDNAARILDVPDTADTAVAHRLTDNAIRVLKARYLKKNAQGQCTEGPDDLFRRVASTIAGAESNYRCDRNPSQHWEDRFYEAMVSGDFLPNSPTLMNAGREMGMLSACFVLPVGDSINEIFDSIKNTALIQKAGGGTGFAFDELRPTGDYIKSSGGTTSGPISFWRAFSEATNAIQQGAFRRGANMGMMSITHPDILKFIDAKHDLSQFTNYNISIKIADAWMTAFLADADGPHVVVNPRTQDEFYLPGDLDIWTYDIRNLILKRLGGENEDRMSPSEARAKGVYSRRRIWEIIVRNAWQTGEPGVVFIDRVNAANPTPHVGQMQATNPCGEQPLLPYEACNLGSINLGRFILDPCTPQARVDWDRLREVVHTGIRFLDNVIDVNQYPLPQITDICRANRKVGLGVMGFADALFMLQVRYNSEEGVAWGERLMKFVNDESHRCSERLAGERGCFPNWKGSAWDTVHHRPMRNATCTTVAPTGTISIIAACSGGVEPLFSLVFYRQVLKGQESPDAKPMIETNPIFLGVAELRGFADEALMRRIAKEGTLAHIPGLPEDIRDVFVCAHDIEPEWHVRMQAAFQKHCDAAISKTINFPREATVGQVDTIYRLAFELNCKGVTVYRDGCRDSQPMALESGLSPSPIAKRRIEHSVPASARRDTTVGDRAERSGEVEESAMMNSMPPKTTKLLEPVDIPEIASALRIKQMTPFGNMHVQITVDPRTERELEVFAQLGKGGELASSDLEAICRLISLWLRAGGSLTQVINQLKDIGSSLQVATKEGRIMSLGDGLARALLKYRKAKERSGLRSLLLGETDPTLRNMPAAHVADKSAASACGAGFQPVLAAAHITDKPPASTNGHGGNGKSSTVRHVDAAGIPVPDGVDTGIHARVHSGFKVRCPECQAPLQFSEGCAKCENCGYAHC